METGQGQLARAARTLTQNAGIAGAPPKEATALEVHLGNLESAVDRLQNLNGSIRQKLNAIIGSDPGNGAEGSVPPAQSVLQRLDATMRALNVELTLLQEQRDRLLQL